MKNLSSMVPVQYRPISIFYTAAVLMLLLVTSCTKFKKVTVKTETGKIITASIIEEHVSVPDSGDIIPVLRTSGTDGWLYNSNTWKESDRKFAIFGTREIEFGKVIKVTDPE